MRQLAILALAAAGAMPAAQAAEEPADPWSGTAALGVLATSGNSETTNANLDIGVGYKRDKWAHAGHFATNGAETDGESTAERYNASYKASYDFNEFDYVFGRIAYEKDKFSGYDQQTSETIGYGRRIINTDTHVLNLEAGAGFRQADLRDGTSENGAILRVGGDYLWNFSDTARFIQTLAIEQGSDNTYLESVSAVKATLLDDLGLVFSYTIKNNSDVPAGSEKTDTFTAISLEYGF